MIISIDWLEEYIEIPFSDDELCEKLTILGLESSLDKKTRTLDIELTPNRPDCMSYLGVARETSILTNKKIELPKISKNLNKNKSKKLTITSNSLDDCKWVYESGFFIGEPLYISDIYAELKKSNDILDVVKVKITNKNSGQYSYIKFDINRNLSQEGSYLICPKNAIFEIKFPEVDIKGKVR